MTSVRQERKSPLEEVAHDGTGYGSEKEHQQRYIQNVDVTLLLVLRIFVVLLFFLPSEIHSSIGLYQLLWLGQPRH